MDITLQTFIEDLLEGHPDANDFFFKRGFRCIRCGEPFWGSISEFLEDSKYQGDKEALLRDLQAFLRTP
jgi:hypothetical protein